MTTLVDLQTDLETLAIQTFSVVVAERGHHLGNVFPAAGVNDAPHVPQCLTMTLRTGFHSQTRDCALLGEQLQLAAVQLISTEIYSAL